MRLKQITATACLSLMFAPACAQAQEEALPSAGGIETLARLEGNAPTPNESYLAKQMQTTIAACMASMIHEVSNTAWWTGGVWDRPFDVLWYPSSWRADNQKFTFRSRSGGGPGPYATITFSNARYDPQQSSINYGPKRIAQNVEVNNDAKTKVIRNDSDATVSVSYDESESLTNTFSTSVTKGMTLDLSVDSTQTISGGYGGVSASVSMQEHFGVSKTSEETHEQSEEGTTEESISIEFDAAPGNYYLVTITKEHEVTYQDFSIDGVMDFDIDIRMPGRNGGRLDSHYPGDHVSVQGVDGFNQFVNGYDTDYPAMQGFLNSAYSRTTNGINCVLDANRRQVHVSGTNQASLESNADYRVESLGGSLPDRLAHLPVEDADDVNNSPQASNDPVKIQDGESVAVSVPMVIWSAGLSGYVSADPLPDVPWGCAQIGEALLCRDDAPYLKGDLGVAEWVQ